MNAGPRLATISLLAFGACSEPARDGGSGIGPSSSPQPTGPATVLSPSDVQVLGSSDVLASVADMEVLGDGTVLVLNSIDPFLVAFGPDGSVLSVHGNQGGGPEEFGGPAGFVIGGIEEDAWVLDAQRHSLIRASRPEDGWSEISIPRDSLPPGSLAGGMSMLDSRIRTSRLGDEIIFPRSYGSIQSGIFSLWLQGWGADLLGFDPVTGEARGIMDIGDVFGDPMSVLEQTDGFPPFPVWFRLWAVCGDSEIRIFDRLRNEVRGFDREGAELEPAPLPPVRFDRVSHEQFARAVFGFVMAERTGGTSGRLSPADSTNLLKEMIQTVQGEPAQLAAFLPRYVDFRCDDEGTLWIQPFDPDAGGLAGSNVWVRIAPGGVADEIHLPDRFDAYRFTPERIWGVQRDEFDIASVAWIAAPSTP